MGMTWRFEGRKTCGECKIDLLEQAHKLDCTRKFPPFWEVIEAYYDEDGSRSTTVEAITPTSDEDLKGLEEMLGMMYADIVRFRTVRNIDGHGND